MIAALYSADGKFQRSIQVPLEYAAYTHMYIPTEMFLQRRYRQVGRVGANALYREEP
jgi:hypothetical protein